MRKDLVRGIGCFMGMLLLIIDAKTAILGAQEAITLCLQSVIPSLFPFLILSGIITSSITAMPIPQLRPLQRLFGVPAGAEGIVLTGLVAGYPVGAQLVAHAYENGQLTQNDAKRMLGFCSNCGPAFIFGILGAKFAESWMVWSLWSTHILSALLVAAILPGKSRGKIHKVFGKTITLTESLKNATKTICYICGWVVLFRIILSFLDRWVLWLVPAEVRTVIYGIFELTNGCCQLELVNLPGLRYILCSGLLAFGGICVTMQTISVTSSLGLGKYLPGKLLQTLVSVVISYFLQSFLFPVDQRVCFSPIFGWLSVLFILTGCILWLNLKIRGRNPIEISV